MGATKTSVLTPDRLRYTAEMLRSFATRYEAAAQAMDEAGLREMDVPNAPSLDQGSTRLRVHLTGLETAIDEFRIGLFWVKEGKRKPIQPETGSQSPVAEAETGELTASDREALRQAIGHQTHRPAEQPPPAQQSTPPDSPKKKPRKPKS